MSVKTFTSVYRSSRIQRDGGRDEGFTLIELLIVLVIIPMVIGAVAIVLITTFRATDPSDPEGTAARLADSHDAQISSVYFVRDVQSAQQVSTSSSPVCAPSGSGSDQVLGLQWTSGGVQVDVSYFVLASSDELVRYFCTGGTLSSTSVISHDVFVGDPPGLVSCSGIGAGASSCAGDSTPPSTTYVATTVSCNNGTVTCASSGLYLVSGTYNDGVTSTSTTWSSQSANFSVADAGQPITGAFIPTGTTIVSPVTSSTNVTLSKTTTGTGTGLSFSLPKRGVKTVMMTIQERRSGFTYTLTGIPRLSNAGGGTLAGPAPFVPPLFVNGPINMGDCNFVVNGVTASNDTSGTAIGSQPGGTLNATGTYTAGGSVNNPPYSGGNQSTGGVIPSPYAGLTEPPTVPSGATYGITTITTTNWDPSTDASHQTSPGVLTPGIYVVQHGMDISKGLVSSGVLFYVTGGSVTLGGNGNINLSQLSPFWESPQTVPPPPTVPEPILWISASDTSPNPPSLTLNGNGNVVTLNGAIYAPTAAVTQNGSGSSGGFNVGGLDIGTITCNGGGAVPINLLAGSPLGSGTVDAPTSPSITLTNSNTDGITVQGEGSLAPTGNVITYACGPLPSPTGCTAPSPTTCTNSTGVYCVGTSPLTTGASSASTTTSAAFTPLAPGNWCFAAYYQGGVSYNASSDTTADGCFTVTGPSVPPAPSFTYPTSGSCYYGATPTGGCTLWGGTITGSATDPSGPGLKTIKLQIESPDGSWWSGSNWVTTATTISTTPTGPSGGTWSWSYAFPAASFETTKVKGKTTPVTGTYTVIATSTDTANASSTPAILNFTWDG